MSTKTKRLYVSTTAPHNFRGIRGKKAVLEKGTTTRDDNNQKKPPIIAATDDIERRAKCLFLKKHFASNEYSQAFKVGEFLKETNNNGNDIDFFTRFCDDDDDPVMMRRKG